MTTYNSDDLKGWEFKIVRTNTQYFKKPENLKKVMDEEAKSGWEMVEKFDNSRVRFKRRVDERGSDPFREIDPYRTNVGLAEGPLAAIIIGVILLVIGGVLVAVFSAKGEIDLDIPVAVSVGILVAVVGLIAAAIKKSR